MVNSNDGNIAPGVPNMATLPHSSTLLPHLPTRVLLAPTLFFFFFLSTFLSIFSRSYFMLFILIYICFERKSTQLSNKKKFQRHSFYDFLSVTRNIHKGIKFFVFAIHFSNYLSFHLEFFFLGGGGF